MKKRYCVISVVGSDSLHRQWIKDGKDFDLHLIVYDNSYYEYKKDTAFICSMKGYKLKLVYRYFIQHPNYLEQYEYIFIPDDDILIDGPNINHLFTLMKKYQLQIAQPALSCSYSTYPHTLRDKLCILHYTNFIEMMAPCFSREAIKKVLYTFNANDSGWGIEWHWPIIIDSNHKDMAVIDDLIAIHTLPVKKGREKNIEECNLYIQKNHLDTTIYIYDRIFYGTSDLKRRGFKITKYQLYQYYKDWLDQTANHLILALKKENIPSIGIEGQEGIILFLLHYAHISEKKEYQDIANSIYEHIYTDSERQNKNPLSYYKQINIEQLLILIQRQSGAASSTRNKTIDILRNGFTLLALLSSQKTFNANKPKSPTINGFSVIMPVYNQAYFIKRAIMSLKKQTFEKWELIIVNDGSTDLTEEVIQDELQDKRIHYMGYKKNQGMGYALNIGLKIAHYDYIAYLPADDLFFENHLEKQKEILEMDDDIILTFSGMEFDDSDSFEPRNSTTTRTLKNNIGLQLVQTAHKKTNDYWMERSQMITDDLFIMFWHKLSGKGIFAPTGQITAKWTNHPYQRHKLCSETYGGNLYKYKWYYQVDEPIRIRMTENRIIDEHILYNTLSHIINKKPILKVLIIGALSYNPERLCALEEYGCQLYGYWKPNPIYAYESVGPFPFGNIENIHNNRYWVEEVKKIDPDVIYTIFSATSVHFVYDSIMTLKNNDINIPFIWHLKESPQACIRYGEWPHLMELYRLSAANIFTNLMTKIWFEQFFYMNKPYMILDQDMPKKDFFTNNFSEKLSSKDQAIHTVIPGRMIGLKEHEMELLASQNIHIHLYSESYYQQKIDQNIHYHQIAPQHFHVHSHCPNNRWVEEFSQYDAGWLHCFHSRNNGNILRASWDDLNKPSRMGVFAAAGIPMIQLNNPYCTVASQELIQQKKIGILYDDIENLAKQLNNKDIMSKLTQNIMIQRFNFAFDHYVPELIQLLKKIAKKTTTL